MNHMISRALKFFVLALIPFMATTALAQNFEPPSDVRNVTATANDESVTLEWDPATDADGIVVRYKIYYGVNAVTEEDGNYDQDIDTGSSQTSYVVSDLINGDTYYFGITALDEQGIESERYSVEVSATPVSSSGNTPSDNVSPILQSAIHSAPNKILVTMSEPVRLSPPEDEAFELTESSTGDTIPILGTIVNSEQVTLNVDPSNLIIDDFYRVTATTGVTDFDGNPVSSGIVDSVEFQALEIFESAPEEEVFEEEEEEVLLEEEEIFEDILEEDEPPVITTPDDFGTFFLDDESSGSDNSSFLDDLLAEPLVEPETDELEPVFNDFGTTNEANASAVESNDLSSAPDLTPPQDARNLSADTSNFQSGSVMVSWTPAVDIENDIKDQILYTRVGLGQWDQGLSLGKAITQASITVQPNQNYQVRLVTTDNAGNESFGAAFEFSTTLSQSGSGQGTVVALMVIALLGFGLLFVGGRRA
jgi:fibronectin type 3 domain-containing protein